ncbi:hypothetical protein BDN72DRAFT_906782, partial [Pluteus cervinus]
MKTRLATAKEKEATPQPPNTDSGSSSSSRRRRSRTPKTTSKVVKDEVTSRKPGQPTPRRLKRIASAPNVRGGNDDGSAGNSANISAIMEVDESPVGDATDIETDDNTRGVASAGLDGESVGGEFTPTSSGAANVLAMSQTPVTHPPQNSTTSQVDLGTPRITKRLPKNANRTNISSQPALVTHFSPPEISMDVDEASKAAPTNDQHIMNRTDSEDSSMKTSDAPVDQYDVNTGTDTLAAPSHMAGDSPPTSLKAIRKEHLSLEKTAAPESSFNFQYRPNSNSNIKFISVGSKSSPSSPTPINQSSISDDKNQPFTKRTGNSLRQEEVRVPRMAWRGYSPRSVQSNIRLWREISKPSREPDAILLEKYMADLHIDGSDPQWVVPERNSTNGPPEAVCQWLAQANHTSGLETSHTHPSDQTPTSGLSEAFGAESSVRTADETNQPVPSLLSSSQSAPPLPHQCPDLSPGVSPASSVSHAVREETMVDGSDDEVEGSSQVVSLKGSDCAHSCGLPQDGNPNNNLAESAGTRCIPLLDPSPSIDEVPVLKTAVPPPPLPESLHRPPSSLGLESGVSAGTNAPDNLDTETLTTNTTTPSDHSPVPSAIEVRAPAHLIPEIERCCSPPSLEVPPGFPQTVPELSRILVGQASKPHAEVIAPHNSVAETDNEGITPSSDLASSGDGDAILASKAPVPPSNTPQLAFQTILTSQLGSGLHTETDGLLAKTFNNVTTPSRDLVNVSKIDASALSTTSPFSSSTPIPPPRLGISLWSARAHDALPDISSQPGNILRGRDVFPSQKQWCSPSCPPEVKSLMSLSAGSGSRVHAGLNPLHDTPTKNEEEDDNSALSLNSKGVISQSNSPFLTNENPRRTLPPSRDGSPPGFNTPSAALSSRVSISPPPIHEDPHRSPPPSRHGSPSGLNPQNAASPPR